MVSLTEKERCFRRVLIFAYIYALYTDMQEGHHYAALSRILIDYLRSSKIKTSTDIVCGVGFTSKSHYACVCV